MTDTLLHILDSVLFFGISLSGIYLFVFAFASMLKRADRYPKAKMLHRFIVLLPTGTTFSAQEYPEDLYDALPYDRLPEAVQGVDGDRYDVAVILGEATTVSSRLLHEVNKAYAAGTVAMQLHHNIEGRTTRKLRRQALCEEISHSLFKQGHTRVGLSSALDGVDIAVELSWLQKNLKSAKSNLERRLLRQNIFIDYLEHVSVSSPAPRIRTHTLSRSKALSDLPEAVLGGHWDYTDKLFQRLIPSWKTLLTLTLLLAVATTCYDSSLSLKWWGGVFCLLLTLCFAIPDYLVEKKKKCKFKNRSI